MYFVGNEPRLFVLQWPRARPRLWLVRPRELALRGTLRGSWGTKSGLLGGGSLRQLPPCSASPCTSPRLPAALGGSSLCLPARDFLRLFLLRAAGVGRAGQRQPSWDPRAGRGPVGGLGCFAVGWGASCLSFPVCERAQCPEGGPSRPPPLRGLGRAGTGRWAGLSPTGSRAAPAEATPGAAALRRGGELWTPLLPATSPKCPSPPHPGLARGTLSLQPPPHGAWGAPRPGTAGKSGASAGLPGSCAGGSCPGSHPWVLTLGSCARQHGGLGVGVLGRGRLQGRAGGSAVLSRGGCQWGSS